MRFDGCGNARNAIDNRLLSLLDAAKVLDHPDVTREQIGRVRQLSSILAQSLGVGLPVGGESGRGEGSAG
jgi:hypothetical protein